MTGTYSNNAYLNDPQFGSRWHNVSSLCTLPVIASLLGEAHAIYKITIFSQKKNSDEVFSFNKISEDLKIFS